MQQRLDTHTIPEVRILIHNIGDGRNNVIIQNTTRKRVYIGYGQHIEDTGIELSHNGILELERIDDEALSALYIKKEN